VAGCCEHGNEPSCSITGGEFLDQMSDHQLLKDSSPWSYLLRRTWEDDDIMDLREIGWRGVDWMHMA
jgi:hypothetical protein